MCYRALLARRGQQRWHTRVITLCLTVAMSLLGASACHLANAQETATTVASSALMGRVVAVGIPGAGALSPVGTFHPGGPIHDKPDFAVFTRPGAVLDPTRLLGRQYVKLRGALGPARHATRGDPVARSPHYDTPGHPPRFRQRRWAGHCPGGLRAAPHGQ